MANTTTIKQKFLDILFEGDPSSDSKPKAEEKKTEERRLKASELLYGKKSAPIIAPKREEKAVVSSADTQSNVSTSAFINYNQDKNIEIPKLQEEEKPEEIYVRKPNLSPIFGDLDATNTKKKKQVTINANYASVDKPASSYLGMPLSPIFGYDSRQIVEEKTKSSKESLDMTQDLGDIFASDEYKQEVKEEAEVVPMEIDLFADFNLDK